MVLEGVVRDEELVREVWQNDMVGQDGESVFDHHELVVAEG